jgi:hypothetical protein
MLLSHMYEKPRDIISFDSVPAEFSCGVPKRTSQRFRQTRNKTTENQNEKKKKVKVGLHYCQHLHLTSFSSLEQSKFCTSGMLFWVP